jgi:hypothetical protein
VRCTACGSDNPVGHHFCLWEETFAEYFDELEKLTRRAAPSSLAKE